MRLSRCSTWTAAAVAAAVLTTLPAAPAGAGGGTSVDHSAKRMAVAVIGNVPYGVPQEATFEYLRLTIDSRDPALFSWERVQVAP